MPDTKSKRSTMLTLPNGRPDLKQLTQRKEIVKLSLEEVLRRLKDPMERRKIETRDLLNNAKVLDDELRVNKLEHSTREPLVVKLIRDDGAGL